MFDDIVSVAGLDGGALVIEIGAGTGIATEPLRRRDLSVTAVEPSAEMAAVAKDKLGEGVEILVGRFEDYSIQGPIQLVASFNAWHWVDPKIAVDRVAELSDPGGWLALVWTEVVLWGEEPFEKRLAELFGFPWVKRLDHIEGSLQPIRDDARFDELQVLHHIFERSLDAESFVEVTKTYGGHRTDEEYEAVARVIDDEFGGSIRKVEDAVLYITRRC